MTRKEKLLVSLFVDENPIFANFNSKEILKFMHSPNEYFDSISPFSWFEHHGAKKMKKKIRNFK